VNKPELLDRIRVVLSHTSHPGNIGAAARAMKTMGLSRLYLINPRHFPDEAAVARASGAQDVLENAMVCGSLEEALAGTVMTAGVSARRRDLSPPMLTPREAAPPLLEGARQGDVALLFGTEVSGLSNADLEKCGILVSIPANPNYSSLNLGAAVQVLAYEMRIASSEMPSSGKPPDLATFDDVERFYSHLEQTLVAIDFLNPRHPKRLMPRLRRLFARAALEKEEVAILRGMLTQVDKIVECSPKKNNS
jgi:tRNA/rRNA methyltransferase